MVKTLILIRHGHRDNSRRELDNGLDDKGREQAKAIKRFYTSRFSKDAEKNGLWLVSSPKIRCVETLAPIAKSIDRPVDIHPALDEQGGKESRGAFQSRIQSFLQEWTKSQAALTLVSSHGDWLPLAVQELLGLQVDPKKGSWFEVEWNSGSAALKWYIPTFKHFFD